MKQGILTVAAATLLLLGLAGCAATDTVVNKDATPAATPVDVSTTAGDVKKPRNVSNAIAAVVNDDIITLFDINREAQPSVKEAEKKGGVSSSERTQLKRAALDRLIEKKLTAQKIRELGIRVSEEEIRQAIDDVRKQNGIASQEALVAALAGQGLTFEQYRSQLQEQLEKLKLVSMEVRAKVHVAEGELRDYYTANLLRYTEDESYRARHVFFKLTDKATADEQQRVRKTAAAVLADARGGKDFADLARRFSEDPAARKDGGDLGSFKKGDMQPELEKVILSLKTGEISEPVATPIGLHIIKLEARTAGAAKPFESVKGEIEELIYRKKSEERFSQWAKDLRGKASVEIRSLEGLL